MDSNNFISVHFEAWHLANVKRMWKIKICALKVIRATCFVEDLGASRGDNLGVTPGFISRIPLSIHHCFIEIYKKFKKQIYTGLK